MPRNGLLEKGLDDDIAAAHQRFLTAMEQRLPALSVETKERYFVVLSALVGKLEVDGKSLREVVQEVMTETAGYILQELGTLR